MSTIVLAVAGAVVFVLYLMRRRARLSTEE